ncbi:MAG: ribonuclease HII [Candidatus Yanofskybacteria bacterium CG10_big_fil_rev_8_21_14_0_10_46_23]|uniref:Ribonuclease HII n=1 Tax=Candidatus Yanofskybacteria bacterium CG10_big_fil_rev_8_21_14_0_10_46_23 TaxID=1975098 RepID=A0A2H0R4A5_9BACT|nr:MAG: ribonuclease HII [Candidatus Yanofskybacteria bacterium CG10_big_fil_rev_8_21_14_0_10_46_23]
MSLLDSSLERNYLRKFGSLIALDEAGRGPLAGPVVACAVLVTPEFLKHRVARVNDSKLLSEKQREEIFSKLLAQPNFQFGLAKVMPKTIDRINILQATHQAMRQAMKKVKITPHLVLVDGNQKISKIKFPQKTIINGDARVYSIACASIIAKVTRDRIMLRYARRFPEYGFESHKGYGTPGHLIQLIKYGPSAIHRLSFAPVAQLR